MVGRVIGRMRRLLGRERRGGPVAGSPAPPGPAAVSVPVRSTRPRVAVVVTSHNESELLADCIASIKAHPGRHRSG